MDFDAARREMIVRQLKGRGIRTENVLNAMDAVPRHLFVPPDRISAAYTDEPVAIGERQTISQPYMVAAMADALLLTGTERVLEIGAGSGYQSAVLSQLAREVITVESESFLAASARERLARLGYSNVRVEEGDGSIGWPRGAPYDAIVVTAGAPAVPPPLFDQLAEGGRLVIPVGGMDKQELLRVVKREGRPVNQSLLTCQFVPLFGRFGWQRASAESPAGDPSHA